jgi:hypothetical protein
MLSSFAIAVTSDSFGCPESVHAAAGPSAPRAAKQPTLDALMGAPWQPY